MHEELVIAGSGGQGVLFIGEIMAVAAMEEGKHTTWFPSYGPAMRGGKANCTVIVSLAEIGSSVAEHPNSLIVMNQPSLEFVKNIKPGGLLVINKSLVDWDFSRKDIEVLEVEASAIAQELKVPQVANMVMLGAYLRKKQTVHIQSVINALKEKLSKKKLSADVIKTNEEALKRGWEKAP